jgi:hypothetical protein
VKIDPDRIREVLDYSPETGLFIWKPNQKNKKLIGKAAGTITQFGYIRICIDGKRYMAHRLAWYITYGHFDSGEIDHINHIKTDNRIANLRLVSKSVNQQNKFLPNSNSSTGILGVSYKTRSDKYIVTICIDGKNRYAGSYRNVRDAEQAYLFAKMQFHPEANIILNREMDSLDDYFN